MPHNKSLQRSGKTISANGHQVNISAKIWPLITFYRRGDEEWKHTMNLAQEWWRPYLERQKKNGKEAQFVTHCGPKELKWQSRCKAY